MEIPISIIIEMALLLVAIVAVVLPVYVSNRRSIAKMEVRLAVQETELRQHKENDEKEEKRWTEVFNRLGALERHLASIEAIMNGGKTQ